MYFKRKYSRKDIFHRHQRSKYDFAKPRRKNIWVLITNQAKMHLKVFLETSSIHGLNHLVTVRRHYFEIFFWLIIIVLSAFGSLYLSSITWDRYQSSPTVISMDKDMFAWNTSFPSVTICPDSIHNIDVTKLDMYLKESKETNKTILKNFILGLANATYNTFEDVPIYSGIEPDNYLALILNLSLPFTPLLTMDSGSLKLSVVMPTITEMGFCYAVNSRTAVYNSPEYLKADRWDIISNENETSYIHPLDGEVFAKLTMNRNYSFTIYVHGPQETPDITSKSHLLLESYYIKIYVTALTVYTSSEAENLSVSQRRCRFPYENNLKHNTIYTYTMCRIECRIRLCLKYCHCVPHFYRRIGDEKICNVEGLHCLAKYKDELYRLVDKRGKRIDCGCLPLCDDVNYVLIPSGSHKSVLGSTDMQWGMVTYPRMRYKRDIIFSFTDVLVAVGGMAGLFLGCCVLSFMEIIYFFSLRLLCYSNGYRSSE